MPDYNEWLGNRTSPINAAVRAVRAWARIQDRATSITVYRGGAAQPAQTVRLEYDSRRGAQILQMAGEASLSRVIVFGVVNHPDPTITDTDLRKGDRFTLPDGDYEIQSVITLPGEIQATAERIS
jgi:hypothetical protein